MTDIENIVFDIVATALRTSFSGIYVSSDNTASPSSYPAVTLVQMDSASHLSTMTPGVENHSDLLFQADIYSDLESGRKEQCKSIASVIDSQMLSLGFYKSGRGPQELIQGADVLKYRMIARYRGVAGMSIDGLKAKVYWR